MFEKISGSTRRRRILMIVFSGGRLANRVLLHVESNWATSNQKRTGLVDYFCLQIVSTSIDFPQLKVRAGDYPRHSVEINPDLMSGHH